ncbi:hypothetical protein BIY24_02835 [Halobacteriovorax marinus]|uniref:Membrane protein n=1 Tax=Halobacteriovorax marinus (strain ATCC BAA-682 / DSM 15412 / SJ) TaxID=862908 RepID=E1X4P8_HALMS|nr:hypothetical protein [Halobacteriovorax marinus]ATH06908.1 hypothetical protein BIY24_02835 [Halobacteriovorax marinus]CBW25478.1 putative membrane protein [Halobacteriovorax marinus SJ]
MNVKFGRSLQTYYAVTFFSLISIIGYGIFYFWNYGPVNINNVSTVFEATLQLDEFKKRDDVKAIWSQVDNDRVRDAVVSLDKVQSYSKKLDSISSVDSYENFETSLKKSKESLNALISYPEVSTIVNVLHNKVSNFENFVVSNSWRTLTRVSKRINAKIKPSRTRGPGYYTYSKLHRLWSSVRDDVVLMERVTEGSVLSREDKNLILTKTKTLKTEITMLENYLGDFKKFRTDFLEVEKGFKTWIKEIEPEISLKKIQFERNSQNMLFSLIALVGIIFILGVSGYFLYRRSERTNRDEVEKVIIHAIKEGVLPTETSFDQELSLKSREEFDKYREYIHKRMSFGSIFQDAMPFSSLLLDSNLNLVWANGLFYEHWGLSEYKNSDDNITWDFLQRFTNLGENDPVITAVKDDVAGIYNIQVKTKQNEESLPFEMYVSPVEYANQRRIMISFYPLRSIEETLSNQSKSLVGPVARTLEALTTGTFNSEFKQKTEKDFDIAGIKEVWSKFQKYHDFVTGQKNGLLQEIERLENDLFDQYKLVNDIQTSLNENTEVQKVAIAKFKDTKNSIIDIVELRNEMEALYQNTVAASKGLFQDEVTLLSQSQKISETLLDQNKALENVDKVRKEYKTLKSNVDQFRGRMMQLLDQSLIFQKTDSSSYKVEQSLSKIKNEVMAFEKVLTEFAKISTALDVNLSKVQLIMQQSEIPNFSELQFRMEEARDMIESDMFNVSRLSRSGQTKDDEMISSLKGLYQAFTQGNLQLAQAIELSTSNAPLEVDLELEYDELPTPGPEASV